MFVIVTITNVTNVSSVFSHNLLHNTTPLFLFHNDTQCHRLLITQTSSNGSHMASHMTSHMVCLTTAKRRFFSTSLVQTTISMTTALTPTSDLPPRPRREMDQSAVMLVTSLRPLPPLTSLMSVLTSRLTVGFPMEDRPSPTPSMTRNREQMKVNIERYLHIYVYLPPY